MSKLLRAMGEKKSNTRVIMCSALFKKNLHIWTKEKFKQYKAFSWDKVLKFNR